MNVCYGHNVADELIRRWLAGVESAASCTLTLTGDGDIAHSTAVEVERMKASDDADFLSSVDWLSGDVGQSTKEVLQGLMRKELKGQSAQQERSKKKSRDPAVTMEMRHREVRCIYCGACRAGIEW